MPKFIPEHWRTVEAVILAAGFRFVRQQGDHRSYLKPGFANAAVVMSRLERNSGLDHPH